MCNLTIKTVETENNKETVVDYRNNKNLVKNEVSFHWWTAEETSMHRHNFYEFFVITDGKTYHELNGETQIISEGTLCMIRPEDYHQFRKLEETSAVHMNISVVESRLEKICEGMNISLASLFRENLSYIELSQENLAFFKSQFQTIGLLDRENRQEKTAVICALIAQCVALVHQSGLKREFNYPDWFVLLLEKINSPENLSCTARDVYKMGGFSSSVMIEYFKKYTGKTVKGYLRDMKCTVACRMLKNTTLTVLEISCILGYESVSHFNRIFKEYTGKSPSHYRRDIGLTE